ncbi:MAG: Crp/Fnr family transcriptional regulator [Elusimicrobia bacterium]|nr:Crp/Fnr family transcriptional regulator [Elusimicrobiota bacterium]
MPQGDLQAFLGHPLFRTLPRRGLETLVSVSRKRRFAPGQRLWHAGDVAGHLCLVTEGLLKKEILTPTGKASIIELIGPGNICGCSPYFCGGRIASDAMAVIDTVVQCVPLAKSFELGKDNPSWFEEIARNLAFRLRRQNSLRCVLAENARLKVPGILLWLRESTGETIPLTQAAIAKVAGLAEETVCRELATLKRRKLVDVSRGGVRITEPSMLKRYLERL